MKCMLLCLVMVPSIINCEPQTLKSILENAFCKNDTTEKIQQLEKSNNHLIVKLDETGLLVSTLQAQNAQLQAEHAKKEKQSFSEGVYYGIGWGVVLGAIGFYLMEKMVTAEPR